MPPVPTVRPDGPRVRELRDQLGLTKTQLARKVKRSRQTVWSVEAGNVTGRHTMRRFARAFRVDLAEITLPDEPQQEDAPAEVAA